MGQVGHALLTRSPLSPPSKARWIPFDLHVLSTPPAFILSQNRTLHKKNAKRHRQMTLKTKIDEHVLKEGRPQKTPPLIKPSRVPDHHDRQSGEE